MIEHPQDFFLSCKDCVLENPRNFYGCFSIGPFQNSQSLTFANALRRTLLSEIRGIAITYVEIDGVMHEYSTLPGIRESILDILLNFKQIVLKKVSPFTKPLYGYLNVRGPGIIRASDLKLPPFVQCVDPDQYIATLNENGKLVLKIQIEDFQMIFKNEQILENFPLNHENNGVEFEINHTEKGGGQDQLKNKYSAFSLQKEVETNGSNNGKLLPKLSNFVKMENKQSFSKSAQSILFPKSSTILIDNRKNKGKIFEKFYSSGNSSFFQKNQKGTVLHFNSRALMTSNLSTPLKKEKNLNVQKSKHLWVDPIFNPILKVNYVIENMEPFQKDKPNQIVMIELWTNGSIHPRKAFYDALFYLKTMFEKLNAMKFLNSQLTNSILESEKINTKFLQNFEKNGTSFSFFEKNNTFLQIQEQKNQTFIDLPIERLQLPSRITKALRKKNLETIGDLLKRTPQNLKLDYGIAHFSILKIQKSLEQMGFEFTTNT